MSSPQRTAFAGDHAEAKLQTAFAFHQQGRFTEARTLYRQLLKHNPNDHYALRYLGLLEAEHGDFPRAKSLLRRSLADAYPQASRGKRVLDSRRYGSGCQ